MFRFQHPEYFWLLITIPVVVLLYIGFLKSTRRKIEKLGEPRLTRQLLKGAIPGRRTTRFALIALVLFCGVFGMANLQTGGHAKTSERKGIDVFFVLDVSKSMLARDISPNRLTRAKQLIFRMMDRMKQNRVGLVIFAGNAYLQVPLTIDYSAMKMLLSAVNPGMVPTQGTKIAAALRLADESFSTKDKTHKAVILISDGEDHDSQAIDAAREMADEGCVIYTVGVGSPEGSTIFDPTTGRAKVDQHGNTVITKLNEAELREIAEAGNGAYLLLGNADRAAENLTEALSGIQKKRLGEVVFTDYNSYFQYFIGVALLLLLLDWFLPAARSMQPKHRPLTKTEEGTS